MFIFCLMSALGSPSYIGLPIMPRYSARGPAPDCCPSMIAYTRPPLCFDDGRATIRPHCSTSLHQVPLIAHGRKLASRYSSSRMAVLSRILSKLKKCELCKLRALGGVSTTRDYAKPRGLRSADQCTNTAMKRVRFDSLSGMHRPWRFLPNEKHNDDPCAVEALNRCCDDKGFQHACTHE